jgi:hypothetical protein
MKSHLFLFQEVSHHYMNLHLITPIPFAKIIEYYLQIQQQLVGAIDTSAKSDLKALLNKYESWR